MLAGLLFASLAFTSVFAQGPTVSPPPSPSLLPLPVQPVIFTDSTRFAITGNYTMGYVNNTVENRCHRAVHKFRAEASGIVDKLKMGVYSQAAAETCGISFVLSTFPGGVAVGSSLLTTFTDIVLAKPGTDEMIVFNSTASGWAVAAGSNYTITILPFTWATGGAAGTSGAASHCVFQMPYGKPGLPYAAIGQYGPTAQPCGATPWVTDLAGDGWALQIMMNGRPDTVIVPSASPSMTPTPTSSGTPTPSSTGTPTPSATPTMTPTNTETPSVTPAPGSSASYSSTSSRTASRTPSISYTPTPTGSITSSVTPTETPSPTPTLRIGASPSVTPTETPGPTDSPSPTHSVNPLAGIAAGPVVAPASVSTGSLIGAAVGGALVVLAVIGVAIRFRIVSAQLNAKTVKSWRMGKNPSAEIENKINPLNVRSLAHENPSLSLRVNRIMHKQDGVGEIAVKV